MEINQSGNNKEELLETTGSFVKKVNFLNKVFLFACISFLLFWFLAGNNQIANTEVKFIFRLISGISAIVMILSGLMQRVRFWESVIDRKEKSGSYFSPGLTKRQKRFLQFFLVFLAIVIVVLIFLSKKII